MKRNVVVDIYPDVYSFFERNNCLEGFSLLYHSAGICRYHCQNLQLEAEVRCYMSTQLHEPVLNINLKEFMDEKTKRNTIRLLDNLITAGIGELGTKSDFECVQRKGIKFAVIFSFFDKIYR